MNRLEEELEIVEEPRSIDERIRYFKKYIKVCQCFLSELEKLKKQGIKKIRKSEMDSLWSKCGGELGSTQKAKEGIVMPKDASKKDSQAFLTRLDRRLERMQKIARGEKVEEA